MYGFAVSVTNSSKSLTLEGPNSSITQNGPGVNVDSENDIHLNAYGYHLDMGYNTNRTYSDMDIVLSVTHSIGFSNNSVTTGGMPIKFSPTIGAAYFSGTVQAQSFYATSDARKKENIRDFHNDKSILGLPIKKFDFIGGAKDQIGCIAQDLQEICPELVNEDKDGYLSIAEAKIIYLVIDEVRELKSRVDILESKIK